MQSYVVATDQLGLSILQQDRRVFACHPDLHSGTTAWSAMLPHPALADCMLPSRDLASVRNTLTQPSTMLSLAARRPS